MKKVFSFFILLLVCMFLLPSLTFALTNYDVLQPIMGMPDQLAIGPTGLSDYLNTLVKVGVSLASGLAVIMIVYGGIQYTLTESVFSKEGAKKTIGNALLGLLLALTAYLILYTLNPDILSLKIAGTRPQDVVTVKAAAPDANIQVVPGGNTGYWGYSSTNPAGGSGLTWDNWSDADQEAFNQDQPWAIEKEQQIENAVNRDNTITLEGNTLNGTSLPNGTNSAAVQAAINAFHEYGDRIPNQRYIGVMDYSQPSSAERFYIVDLQTGEVTATKAAHGLGSDPNNTGVATNFSDTEGSKMSTSGAFVATSYVSPSTGRNVLLMNGLESGNQNAASRGLEIHPSNYVNADQCGRSYGCIAYPQGLQSSVNTQLKDALIYNYH